MTERCTLRCAYCRADEGICPKKEELTTDEFLRLASACAVLGIRKVRVTGGEPLLRRDILAIVGGLAAIPGIAEVDMTSNAQMLQGQAAALKQAGLQRVNISLDSLDAHTFHEMTGGDLAIVLAGIEEAISAGLIPVRINAVLVRGRNEREVDDFIALTKDQPVDVRFIELMPIGELGQDDSLRVGSDELLAARPYLKPVPPLQTGQVSTDYAIHGHLGRVGFISPVSHKFCATCNRIRIMSDGTLRPCLGNNLEVPLKPYLSMDDARLTEAIRQAIYRKPAGHHFEQGFVSQKNMSEIGG